MAPAPLGTIHFVEETVYKAEKALIAAKFNGVVLTASKFDAIKDASKPEFLAKNPTGKVPYLETDMGCVFTSNAIARFIARSRTDTSIYGRCFNDEGEIDTWMEFCTHDLEVPLMTWVYPVLGLMEDAPKVTIDAIADVKKALKRLEEQLKKTPFLIGDFVTLADIVIVCALKEGFKRVFDPSFRKSFPKATAWFETCCALPQFAAVLGKVPLCSTAEKPKPVLAKFAPPSRQAQPAAKAEKCQPAAKAATKAAPKSEAAAPKAAVKSEDKGKSSSPPAASVAQAQAGGNEAAILEVGEKIRALKEKLKGEGLSGKKVNDHEEVKKLVAQLQELKAGAAAAPSPQEGAEKSPAPVTASAAVSGDGEVEAQIKAVGDEIRTLKEKLKAEGLSGKKINEHEDIKKLVEKLTELKAKM